MSDLAKVGDPVSCPVCGITSIANGSVDTFVDNQPVALVGFSHTACPCASLIVSGQSWFNINGYHAAVHGSKTANGGSVLASSTLKTGTPNSAASAQATPLHKPNRTTNEPGYNPQQPPSKNSMTFIAEPVVCNHPDQMEELASYIAGEMNRNIHHPAVLKMKELISYDSAAETRKFLQAPWYARLTGPPNFNGIALAKQLEAMAIWTKQVGQNMEWDHKPKLQAMYNGVVWHKQGEYDYYYDIWSNIHYGYIGIAGGFSESVLLDGAGAEQIVSDSFNKIAELKKPEEERRLPGPHPTASPWTELRSWDDIADRVSIGIGVKLYKQYPVGGLTAKVIMDEVLAIAPENWGDGIRDHACK